MQHLLRNNFQSSPQKISQILLLSLLSQSLLVFFLCIDQLGANHAPRASVTQVNHSVHTLSTFLRIRADPSMQIF